MQKRNQNSEWAEWGTQGNCHAQMTVEEKKILEMTYLKTGHLMFYSQMCH